MKVLDDIAIIKSLKVIVFLISVCYICDPPPPSPRGLKQLVEQHYRELVNGQFEDFKGEMPPGEESRRG